MYRLPPWMMDAVLATIFDGGQVIVENTSSSIIKQVEEAAPGIVSLQVYYLFFTMSNVLHDVTCVLVTIFLILG
jgi:hypothetical protein